VCPFKGLAPFEPDDHDFFFGRERLVEELVARLDSTAFLLLTGPSGSGKSSLLRAGLLPALEGRRVVIRPGPRPSVELTRALGSELPSTLGSLLPVAARCAAGTCPVDAWRAADLPLQPRGRGPGHGEPHVAHREPTRA